MEQSSSKKRQIQMEYMAQKSVGELIPRGVSVGLKLGMIIQ